jgi:MFS family permease
LTPFRLRSLFFGLLQVTWALAGGVGPVLGGVFSQYLTWRWIFWINLPFSGAAFCLLFLFLDVHDPKTTFADGVKAIDWAGSFSIVAVMVMVLLGLNFGGTAFPWDSPKVICLVAVGALMAVFFVFNEGRLAKYPIMPLGVFRNKSNVACLVICFAQHFVRTSCETVVG